MEIGDLRPGDILLLSNPEADPVTACIARLTDAPISRVAMVYTDPETVVEQIPPRTGIQKTRTAIQGHVVFVKRNTEAPPLPLPILQATRRYLNGMPAPANPDLIYLAKLLLFRKFFPGKKTQQAISRIFLRASDHVLEILLTHGTPRAYPMTNARLVYQCYRDAGKKYNLRRCPPEAAAGPNFSLLMQASRRVATTTDPDFRKFLDREAKRGKPPLPTATPDALATDLLVALERENGLTHVPMTPELLVAIQQFCAALHTAHLGAPLGNRDLVSANATGSPTPAMSHLRTVEPAFLTPADLLRDFENLETMGVLKP